MLVQPKDRVGQKFGRLLVKSVFLRREKNGKTACRAQCICDCGKEHEVAWDSLRDGHTKSCGCFRDEFLRAGTQTTHGMSKGRTYRIWRHMRNRCHLKTHPRFSEWGGRGITVCERWHKFENFYADMGEALPGMSIDRKDNDLGYYKENCRWVDDYTQSQNRRWLDTAGVRKQGCKYKITFTLFGKKYYKLSPFNSDQEAIDYRRSWRQEVLNKGVDNLKY